MSWKKLGWLALICLMVPMFASYFFDDCFSTLSQIFQHPETLELGWDSADYGFYAGGYSFLCVCGGLIVCGILLDVFGVRIVGSIFVGLMALGALTVVLALRSGLEPRTSLLIAYAGCMIFGLGSEIAGVAVTRSIAKWFKDGPVAFAMGAQVAVARLGTALAFILSPILVAQKAPGQMYTLAETARPATFGLALIMGGVLLWGIFVAMDARFDKAHGIASGRGAVKEEDKFKFSDIGRLLTNGKFLLISLLCVFFYCCIISFKKFGTSIVIPRFGMELESAKWVITMIPFFTVVFTPLFGAMVDKVGKATLWMVFGSVLVLAAHLVIAFAPQGVPFWGYFGIGMLGIGYSLVPSAMWPSVPKIVPERNLGTAYSLIYWIQNMGMLLVPIFVGRIFRAYEGVQAAVRAEWIFIGLGCVAVLVAVLLRKKS
ncbi:MAG: MFS transporter [Bacteroidales bacterium]|nr:MFS transporter [Bacteroidales bacterium]MBQ1718971.1 MFS transporter [Bacteroidales bacterium]MBQ2161704.1 MFS transporter [Bacteroidales bacterium]